jgi:hypothetical protein
MGVCREVIRVWGASWHSQASIARWHNLLLCPRPRRQLISGLRPLAAVSQAAAFDQRRSRSSRLRKLGPNIRRDLARRVTYCQRQ